MELRKNIFYVYQHIRNDTGECFYIGKGCGTRHKSIHTRNPHWKNVVNKAKGFKSSMLAERLTEKESFCFERAMIKGARKSGCELVNATDGGEGSSGFKHSEASKIQMSKTRQGKSIHSVERKLQLSEIFKSERNPTQTETAKIKRRNTNLNRFCGSKNPRAIKIKLGDLMFGCVKDLAEFLKISPPTLYSRLYTNPSKYGYEVIK